MQKKKTVKKHENAPKKGKFGIVKFLAVCAVVFYFSFTFISQQLQMNENSKALAEVNSEIAVQKERNEQLQAMKKTVNTPEYIEKIAREKLDFVAPDEIVFIDSTQAENQ